MIKSPFKFLDSFTLADREIFFGRDQEITDLYRRIFESKMLLVYGISGTGKSSLINCGLASRFDESDWLPLNVRRGNNIIESLHEALKKNAVRPFKKIQTVTEKLQSIYLDNFKPLYFIFDQFEELFIFGSNEERRSFIRIIKEIIESETQCRVIFIIREEFLAGITEFEGDIPEIFTNRFRVEKMKRANALQAVEGPCKVHNIETEAGFSEELIDKLCPAGNDIELTFLQIYLDRIFRIVAAEKKDQDTLKFSKELLSRAGSVSDLLSQFLEEQIREFDDPDAGMAILKSFVSVQGTKKPMREPELLVSAEAFGLVIAGEELLKYLTKLVSLRILSERDETGHFELRHDSLAAKIYEKFTSLEKDIIEVRQFIENAFSVYEKRGKLLTADDLKYIAPYEDKLFLNKPCEAFIRGSKNEISRTSRRRRNFAVVAAIALIIVLAGFTFWALSEKQKAFSEKLKADQNYLRAKANNFNYLSKETIETDPTVALRLAEYAVTIDTGNKDIVKNLKRIYSDNNFYKVVAKHEDLVNSVAFSPDGKSILTGSNDMTAHLCDSQGNIIQVFRGHANAILSVAFSPDGKNILTGSTDKTARLWDLKGKVLQVFKGHEKAISSVAFSPDGESILTGSSDNTARIWDLQGNVIQAFKGHKGTIYSVAFSPNGKSILTGSEDKTAWLWDLHGSVIQVFKGHIGTIYSVAFSPDSKSILTGSGDKTTRLWDLHANVLQISNGHQDGINSVSFSPDGKFILTGSLDRTVRLWDLKGNVIQIFKGHTRRITSVAFSSDGKSILTGSGDKTARLWELKGNVMEVFKGHEDIITSVAFSPDGKNILTGSFDKTARLWNLHGNLLHIFKGHKDIIFSVAFSPDGKSVLTGSTDKTARLWDMQGNVLHIFKGHQDQISSVAFSPDGKSILTGSYDGTARLWDMQVNLIRVFSGHKGSILSIAFSPDGKSILTGSSDKTIRLWDLKGNVIQVFRGHEEQINSIAFSSDGKKILTGSNDGTTRLWDLKGNMVQMFRENESYPFSVAVSPDGRTFLTGYMDNTTRLWDLQGNVIQVFKGQEGYITSLAFSPDGKSILTGSFDGTARLWEIREPLKEFQKKNLYQELSVKQKLGYGILELKDILKLNDKKLIYETAEYYYEGRNLVGKDKKTEYINNAEFLFHKGLALDTIHGLFARRLTEICIEKHQFNKEDIKKEIDKYFDILFKTDNLNDLIISLEFYADGIDSTTVQYGYSDKAISIAEKLSELSLNDRYIRSQLSLDCNNLSFYSIGSKQFKNSLTAIKIAIEADSTFQLSYSNLPLAYMFNNMYSEAESEYRKWKDTPWTIDSRFQTFREVFLADIADLESRGIVNPGFAKIKVLLKN